MTMTSHGPTDNQKVILGPASYFGMRALVVALILSAGLSGIIVVVDAEDDGSIQPIQHLSGEFPGLAEPRTIQRLVGLDDDLSWKALPGGGEYRLSTQSERETNAWEPGGYLLKSPVLAELALGNPSLMSLRDSEQNHTIVLIPDDVRLGTPNSFVFTNGTVDTDYPTIIRFQAYDLLLERHLGKLMASTGGGLYGAIDFGDEVAYVLGPNSLWVLDESVSPGYVMLLQDDAHPGQFGTPAESGSNDANYREIVSSLVQVAHNQTAPLDSILTPISPVLSHDPPLVRQWLQDELGSNQRHHCSLGLPLLEEVHDLLHDVCVLAGIAAPACEDGIDNDGDNWVDYPEDPGCSDYNDDNEIDSRYDVRFGMNGETKWCTNVGTSNWSPALDYMADDIERAFDNNGGTRADLNHRSNICWFSSNMSDAEDCDDGTTVCNDGNGHVYPYNGCDLQYGCYKEGAWDMVSYIRHYDSFTLLDAEQTAHHGVMWTVPGGSGSPKCGLASFPQSSTHYSGSPGTLPTGDSVAAGDPGTAGCPNHKISAHEMGHNFDGEHRSVLENGCYGLMQDGSSNICFPIQFFDHNRARINECVHNDNAFCPRSGRG